MPVIKLYPNSTITRDIANLILFPNGALPFVIDGKIAKLVISEHANHHFEYKVNKRDEIKSDFKNSGKDMGKEILRGIATFASGLLVANLKKILKIPTQ